VTGFLSYNNLAFEATSSTDIGGSFSASPSISNLRTPQVPDPSAEFTGASAEFTLAGATARDVQLVGLISHDLPDGASVQFKQSGGTNIGSAITVARYKNRPNNIYLLLDSALSLTAIRCAITSAGSGAHNIGTIWAGQVWEFGQLQGQRWSPQSSASVTRVAGTDWVRAGVRRRGFPGALIGTRGEILGVNADGTAYSGEDAETIFNEIGQYGPVIYCPSSLSQSTIDATAIYGVLESPGSPEHIEGDVFRARFNVLESR